MTEKSKWIKEFVPALLYRIFLQHFSAASLPDLCRISGSALLCGEQAR
jgi:hypothetical protein